MSNDDRWHAFAQAMRREVSRHFPGWTDSNAHDPGVTLLELLAWLAENIPYRTSSVPAPAGADLAQRLSSAARALAGLAWSGEYVADGTRLQRVNYFAGKLLDVEDFRDEQEYFRRRLRRLNRALHGVGSVTGLNVSIAGAGNQARVIVEPGLALDAHGEEIEVTESVSLPLPKRGKGLFVQVRYAERPGRPVPVIAPDDVADTQQYSRTVETFEALLSPTEDANAVTLARLRHVKGRWVVARRFNRK